MLGHAHQLARPPVDTLLDQREEDGLLAVEVPVDGALCQAGRGGQVLYARGAVAALGEHLGGGVEQPFARRPALLAVPSVGLRHAHAG
jgi:hypothetical protein